jgi:hypothetical protein
MGMWGNQSHRQFGGKVFYLAGEGLAKDAAQEIAQMYRNRNHKARVVSDTRLGRIKWCVYVEE